MQPKMALTTGAVAAAVFGLLFVLAPGPMLESAGLTVPDEGIILMRDLGVTLLGLAVLNWTAREATGKALRAVLSGNLVIQILEIVVNGYGVATGMIPGAAAGGILVHVVIGAIMLLGLRRAGETIAA